MGNYVSTLLGKGNKYDDKLALQMSRLAFHQQLLATAKSTVETRYRSIAETYEDEKGSVVVALSGKHNDETDSMAVTGNGAHKDKSDSKHYKDCSFEFENLVLRGGGAKGIAYCGAIKYLEEIGLMQKITRLAGNSAGALVALMLAVGYKSDEIEKFTRKLDEILFDVHMYPYGFWNPFNIYLIVETFISNYGIRTGKRLYDYLGERIKKKGLHPDVTFKQLLDEKKITLCIVITNLNYKCTEYCHPKTTPNMPIRLAARMSMSYPGVFKPIKHKLYTSDDWFVDGGLLCNYPIHCFDGWFLSMEENDTFLNRIQTSTDIASMADHKNCFTEENHKEVKHKTLGIIVHADSDDDVLQWHPHDRPGCDFPNKPEPLTSLYIKCAKSTEEAGLMKISCQKIKMTADEFLKAVKDRHKKDTITLQELVEVYKLVTRNKEQRTPEKNIEASTGSAINDDVSEEEKKIKSRSSENQIIEGGSATQKYVLITKDFERLFGENVDPIKAFEILFRDKNKIHLSDLRSFLYENGILMQEYFYGKVRTNITGIKSYAESIISSLLLVAEKAIIKDSDYDRTVGINTGYVGTMDFKLEDADVTFLIERGYNGTHAFFQDYEAKYPGKVKRAEF